MNNQLTLDELGCHLRQIRFKLEIESYLQPNNDMWKSRFYNFLKYFVSEKKIPKSLMLSDIINHVINHPNHKLREYLNDLPGYLAATHLSENI